MDVNFDNQFSDLMSISHYESSLALSPPPVLQAASIKEPSNWCTVSYYEMKNRVGAQFLGYNSSFIVDGFTDPNSESDRFCLGLLSNINRDQSIEQTRMHIGKGVRIFKQGPIVYAECLSKSSVFVQGLSVSEEYRSRPDYVFKLSSGNTIKLFNNQTFAESLNNSAPNGYEAVFRLNEMCTIRMSFVKGWGPEYRRQHVVSTPCWIEIRLNGPLQWLDRVLSQLGSSGAQCSSVS